MRRSRIAAGQPPLKEGELRRLAWFRYRIRRFLRTAERVARACGATPAQHQLLLGIEGYTGRGWATISELAEFLQARHNAVVGLVQRAARRGLVRRAPGDQDRRWVKVYATGRGRRILAEISRRNIAEARKLQLEILTSPHRQPPSIPAARGA